MSDEFEFEAWSNTYELTKDTQALLQQKGFTSYKTLAKLDEAKVTQYFGTALQKIPGQLLMLQEAVQLFHLPAASSEVPTAQPGPSHRRDDAGDDAPVEEDNPVAKLKNGEALSAAEVAAILRTNPAVASSFNTDAGGQVPPRASPGELLCAFDPYQFGRDRFSTKKRQVADFVSSLAKSEETAVVSLGGVEFHSTATKRLQHDRLSVAQYMEGALRILRAMVLEDGIPQEQTMDYINYVIQVAVFAQAYPWMNVLAYDKVYRQEQHDLGFRWGTASPFLMTSRLQKPLNPAMDTRRRSSSSNPRPAQPKDPKSGTIICQKFNGVNGCNLVKCSYAHVCRACFAEHPEHEHKRLHYADPPKN